MGCEPEGRMMRIKSIGPLLLGVLLGMGAIGSVCWWLWPRDHPTPEPPSRYRTPPDAVQLEAPTDEVDLTVVALPPEGEEAWIASGDPEGLPVLVRHLRSGEEIVQLAALAELAGMGRPARKAGPAIVGALRDPKGAVRVRAAMTLIQLDVQARAAIAALREELVSQDAADRARAGSAIEDLADPPEHLGTSCWGPDPLPRIARPWVRRAQAR
jgi:hypothetical protein